MYLCTKSLDAGPCVATFDGNGYCNAVNNRPECGYDGGDCCLGTDVVCKNCYGDWCRCHETGETLCLGLGKRPWPRIA